MEPEFLTVEKVSRLLLVYGNSYDPQDPVEHDEAPEGSGLAFFDPDPGEEFTPTTGEVLWDSETDPRPQPG